MGESIQIRVHRVPGHESGKVIPVDVCEDGIPLSREWRRRLKDAKTDGCCEVVSPAPLDETDPFETVEPRETDEQ